MERSVHKYVYNYCIENKVFTPFQSGFIQGDSTTYQLINLYDTFCEAVDAGKEVRVVFLDITMTVTMTMTNFIKYFSPPAHNTNQNNLDIEVSSELNTLQNNTHIRTIIRINM